jgi:hypothetical protein
MLRGVFFVGNLFHTFDASEISDHMGHWLNAIPSLLKIKVQCIVQFLVQFDAQLNDTIDVLLEIEFSSTSCK